MVWNTWKDVMLGLICSKNFLLYLSLVNFVTIIKRENGIPTPVLIIAFEELTYLEKYSFDTEILGEWIFEKEL